jgi:hypothetical protein
MFDGNNRSVTMLQISEFYSLDVEKHPQHEYHPLQTLNLKVGEHV